MRTQTLIARRCAPTGFENRERSAIRPTWVPRPASPRDSCRVPWVHDRMQVGYDDLRGVPGLAYGRHVACGSRDQSSLGQLSDGFVARGLWQCGESLEWDVVAGANDSSSAASLSQFDLRSWGKRLWAVGEVGMVVHTPDRANWTQQPTNLGRHITDVWGSSTSNVWAVAHYGYVLHYDGGTWTNQTISPWDFEAISATSASDIWAVGATPRIREPLSTPLG